MMNRLAMQSAAFAAVLLIWETGVYVGDISPAVLPPVAEVATAAVELWGRDTFWSSIYLTVRDAAVGLVIASALGIPAGLVIGSTPWLERSTRLMVDFGRSFPQIALLPILLMVLGTSSAMKIVLIAFACFFPILLQTIYGTRQLDSTLRDTVRAYRIPVHLKYLKVILPAASPMIMTGLRISVVVSILVAIAIEITSPVKGMGDELSKARDFYETNIAIAYALYAGLLGVIVNAVADRSEKHFLSWHFRSQEA